MCVGIQIQCAGHNFWPRSKTEMGTNGIHKRTTYTLSSLARRHARNGMAKNRGDGSGKTMATRHKTRHRHLRHDLPRRIRIRHNKNILALGHNFTETLWNTRSSIETLVASPAAALVLR